MDFCRDGRDRSWHRGSIAAEGAGATQRCSHNMSRLMRESVVLGGSSITLIRTISFIHVQKILLPNGPWNIKYTHHWTQHYTTVTTQQSLLSFFFCSFLSVFFSFFFLILRVFIFVKSGAGLGFVSLDTIFYQSMMSGRNRFPFTATQWQELEHQALIFKYMASGMPIPPDLIFSIKRSLDSPLPTSKLFPTHQSQHSE